MKDYIIEWETDYCEDFPEHMGETIVKANSTEEAVSEFRKLRIPKAIIFNVKEVRR